MKPSVHILRTIAITLISGLFTWSGLLAQQQQGFSYQAVARDPSGAPMADQDLSVRIEIREGTLEGTVTWSEEHSVTTGPLGLFTLTVGDPAATGQGGSALSFDQIDWAAGPYHLRVWVDEGNGFMDMGGSQIQSVPMAQFASSAKNAAGSFSVQPSAATQPGEALFEVKRADGQPVFAVYEDMVWVYSDPAGTKGIKGGFAVGGYNRTKGVTEEYMRVTADSVRVYIESDPTGKGIKGGFAVGGYNRTKAAGDELYHYISGRNAVDVIENASQILWYPRKEALLSGNIHVGSVDSVGQNSTAMGFRSVAMGNYSQAFGYRSMSIGDYSTSFGNRSIALGEDSYALGSGATATGNNAFAIGVKSTATGTSSMALGTFSEAINHYSTSLGYRAEASGLYSHAFGLYAHATGERAMALGMTSTASGLRSLSLGYGSTASAPYSVAIGANSITEGDTAISIGSEAIAAGPNSLAIGTGTQASNRLATAIGYNAIAEGFKSISIGAYYYRSLSFILPIIIIPPFIFPKGMDELVPPKVSDARKGTFVLLPLTADRDNVATGTYSMALGNGNRAENSGVAVGVFNDALQTYSTAVGFGNQAVAPYSFAGGFANKTEGEYSTAFGRFTSAASLNSFAIGTYNVSAGTPDEWIPTDPLFQIGNGASRDDQHDAFRVNKNGTTYINASDAVGSLWAISVSQNSTSTNYGVISQVIRNNANASYYSGYFYDAGSGGTYNGLYADVRSGDAIDVAEYIYDTFGDTEAADVVVADREHQESVVKSSEPYQTSVVGVITTSPHLVMGMELVLDKATGKQKPDVQATRLALTGRVPVKVTDENGPIEPGDLLTTSSTQGRAMRWSLLDVSTAGDFEELKNMLAENERRRNAIIGKSLGSSGSVDGTVMVLISLQ